MILGQPAVTKDDILRDVSQEDIFRRYCTSFSKLNTPFRSDLRPGDTNPSCSITSYGQLLVYKDFGTPDKAMDVWSYLCKKYGISFGQALEMVASDFNIRPGTPIAYSATSFEGLRKGPKKNGKVIQIRPRLFNLADKEFWYDRYFLSLQMLNAYKVIPISAYWIDGMYRSAIQPAYCFDYYVHEGRLLRKIYQPFAGKEDKWKSNINNTVVQGIANIPKTAPLLIITKSLKDVMCLNMLGYPSVAPNTESSWIPGPVWEKFITRYEKMVILFDSDETGMTNALHFSKVYNIPFIWMPINPNWKDVSDHIAVNRDLQLTSSILKRKLKDAGIG